ncbi:hypothetical protein N3K66_006915 [Trichothecium roseum]|uniref:Uncharacterized protein n=1 Tax=Trichothecium roseum TaxID=47278 RepID=A0ACC0UYC6_9HYPO|nr:hypothetical protein N3K66_006915 [Trichothecium roseum]
MASRNPGRLLGAPRTCASRLLAPRRRCLLQRPGPPGHCCRRLRNPYSTQRSAPPGPSHGTTEEHVSAPKPPGRSKRTLVTSLTVLALATSYLLLPEDPSSSSSSSSSGKNTTLNETTFAPYTIVNREVISPASFVLTLAPPRGAAAAEGKGLPYLVPDGPSSSSGATSGISSSSSGSRWRYPLWSVEFKQPQVQISRHYTPLPPPNPATDGYDAGEEGQCEKGELRFYIRAPGAAAGEAGAGGEMTRYLLRLREGDRVELRGPHVGFDVLARLGGSDNNRGGRGGMAKGSGGRVVFLAGGTGVAPGLQAAQAALQGSEDARVSLLWAVRGREEIQARSRLVPQQQQQQQRWWQFWGSGGNATSSELPLGSLENPSPVARQLEDMKRRYGDRLTVHVAVDEEGTRFDLPSIQKAINAAPSPSPSSFSTTTGTHPDTPTIRKDTSCALHEQRPHERASEFEAGDAPTCSCPADHGPPGRNLLIVSGPDGFVSHYAGPKVWQGGRQTQGAVGGVLGEIQARNPQLAREWLVLKL